jgi:hypothetical protein
MKLGFAKYVKVGGNNIHCACRIRKALENRTNMEDDRVAILEAQLSQAKLIAEEADKKYEEVRLEVAAATSEVSVGDGDSFCREAVLNRDEMFQ